MSHPEEPPKSIPTLTERLQKRWLEVTEGEKKPSKLVAIAAEVFVRNPGNYTNQHITTLAKKFEKWSDDALIAAITSATEAMGKANLQDAQVLTIIVMGAILKNRGVEDY